MIFSGYMLAYAVLRFLTEFLRGDDRGGSWLGFPGAIIIHSHRRGRAIVNWQDEKK